MVVGVRAADVLLRQNNAEVAGGNGLRMND
jgi:hypothetical protein